MITLIIIGLLLHLINYRVWSYVQVTMYLGAWTDTQLTLWDIFHKVLFVVGIGCVGVGIYKFFVK